MTNALLKLLLHWGQTMAIGGVVAALVCLGLLWRRRRARAWGWPSRIGAGLSALLLLGSAGGLVLVRALVGSEQGQTLLMLDRHIGSSAPRLSFRDLSAGRERALSDHAGKVVLLNLWATWCKPCMEEMKHLERLQADHPNDLVVLAISDEEREALETYLASKRWGFTCGHLPDVDGAPEVIRAMQAMRPLTLVIDRGGTIQDWLGASTYEELDAAVRQHL